MDYNLSKEIMGNGDSVGNGLLTRLPENYRNTNIKTTFLQRTIVESGEPMNFLKAADPIQSRFVDDIKEKQLEEEQRNELESKKMSEFQKSEEKLRRNTRFRPSNWKLLTKGDRSKILRSEHMDEEIERINSVRSAKSLPIIGYFRQDFGQKISPVEKAKLLDQYNETYGKRYVGLEFSEEDIRSYSKEVDEVVNSILRLKRGKEIRVKKHKIKVMLNLGSGELAREKIEDSFLMLKIQTLAWLNLETTSVNLEELKIRTQFIPKLKKYLICLVINEVSF
jgi:hypothetical protein